MASAPSSEATGSRVQKLLPTVGCVASSTGRWSRGPRGIAGAGGLRALGGVRRGFSLWSACALLTGDHTRRRDDEGIRHAQHCCHGMWHGRCWAVDCGYPAVHPLAVQQASACVLAPWLLPARPARRACEREPPVQPRSRAQSSRLCGRVLSVSVSFRPPAAGTPPVDPHCARPQSTAHGHSTRYSQ